MVDNEDDHDTTSSIIHLISSCCQSIPHTSSSRSLSYDDLITLYTHLINKKKVMNYISDSKMFVTMYVKKDNDKFVCYQIDR